MENRKEEGIKGGDAETSHLDKLMLSMLLLMGMWEGDEV